jgi:hypothetical protein
LRGFGKLAAQKRHHEAHEGREGKKDVVQLFSSFVIFVSSFENGGGGRNRIMGNPAEPCPMSKPRRERTPE